jgi:hypothetical protein
MLAADSRWFALQAEVPGCWLRSTAGPRMTPRASMS